MQKFEKSLQFSREIKFHLDGDFLVKFIESKDGNDFLRVNHSTNPKKIEIKITEDHVSVIDKSKFHVDDSDFGNFKNSIAQNKGIASAVTSFVSDALHFASRIEESKHEIFIEVYLGASVEKKSISLKAGNLRIAFENIEFDDVYMSAGNMKLDQFGFASNSMEIKSGNLKANISFNEDNRKIKIKASNAKIHLNKRPSFNGLIVVTGNNVKMDREMQLQSGDKDVGFLNAKINNGTIKLVKNDNLLEN